jgi:hypothetical protein
MFFIKRSKESGTTASKQQNSETTTKLTNDRGESKKVKIVENNQTQKVTRKGCSNISHTLLTPPDKLHDEQRMNNSKGQKK